MSQPPIKSHDSSGYQSLRAYLNPSPQGSAYLRLPLNADGTDSDRAGPAPWEAAGPVADLIKAAFSFAEEAPVMDVFLLAQADEPRVGAGELRALTNTDIERLWQDAMSSLEQPVASLCRQDGQGGRQACLPLFVCRHKNVFFHPPCPHCGVDLTLCRDDRLLEQAGLPAFSTSLERHLYCAGCHASNPAFYVKHSKGEPGPGVMDGMALFGQFSRLLAKGELAEKLPCIGCEAAGQCFGPDDLVSQRLAAVRFYPFFLLSQPARSINALDFLALLAGEDADRLETELVRQGKTLRLEGVRRTRTALGAGSGLLFAYDQRHFGELLYLKLVFLRSLVQLAGRHTGASAQVAREMSLAGLWVHLPERAEQLPLFWDFALHCVDPVGAPAESAPGVPPATMQASYFLGRAWFYVLLANDRQSFADVLAGLEHLSPESAATDNLQEQAMFDPRNIFHGQTPSGIDSRWHSFWERSLQLGRSLLPSDAGSLPDQPAETLVRGLDQLCAELHQALFEAPAGRLVAEAKTQAEAGEPAQAADQPVKRILESILEKWSRPMPKAEPAAEKRPSEVHVDEDGDVEETVILTDTASYGVDAGPAGPTPGSDPDKTVVVPMEGQSAVPPSAELEATVLSTPGQPQAQPRSDPDKTVVIPQTDLPSKEDELEKTVMITPNEGRPSGASQAPPVPPTPPTAAREDDLEETIVQGSTPHAPPPAPPVRPPAPPTEGEDDLEATVIIDPSKLKNRKR